MMNYESFCAIWDTPAEQLPVLGPHNHCVSINSPRASGKYIVNENIFGDVARLDERVKVKLTVWLIEQRSRGDQYPEITEEAVLDAKESKELKATERAGRILEYLKSKMQNLGTGIRIPMCDKSFDRNNIDEFHDYFDLLNHSECGGSDELICLFDYLEKRETVQKKQRASHSLEIILTVEGYELLESIE